MLVKCVTCEKEFNRKKSHAEKCAKQYCSSVCRRTGKTLKCEHCGDIFYVISAREDLAKYCSKKCSQLDRKKFAICFQCGKEFHRLGAPSKEKSFCSRKCSSLSRRTYQDHPCPQCGSIVTKNRNFCSMECANLWQGRNKVEKTCIQCGDMFKLSPSWEQSHAGLYCSLDCRNASPIHRQRLIAMNVEQQRKKPNKLEIAGEKILNKLGVFYITQALVANKFVVDAFIPILGVVVQWDGDYWHGYGVPAGEVHPEARIRKRMRLDRSQDAYMKECGYTVLRFWEHEVTNDPQKVSEHIRAAI